MSLFKTFSIFGDTQASQSIDVPPAAEVDLIVVVSPVPDAGASDELRRLGLTPAGPCVDCSDELGLLARVPSSDLAVVANGSHYDMGGVWL